MLGLENIDGGSLVAVHLLEDLDTLIEALAKLELVVQLDSQLVELNLVFLF